MGVYLHFVKCRQAAGDANESILSIHPKIQPSESPTLPLKPYTPQIPLNPHVLPSPQNTYNPHKHTLFTQLSPHQVVGTFTPTTFSFYRKTINQAPLIPL